MINCLIPKWKIYSWINTLNANGFPPQRNNLLRTKANATYCRCGVTMQSSSVPKKLIKVQFEIFCWKCNCALKNDLFLPRQLLLIIFIRLTPNWEETDVFFLTSCCVSCWHQAPIWFLWNTVASFCYLHACMKMLEGCDQIY